MIDNKKKLIQYLISNSGRNGKTWIELAEEFDIYPSGNYEDEKSTQRAAGKKANDIWRTYLKKSPRDLELVKKSYHKGNLVTETFKKRTGHRKVEYNPEDFEIQQITEMAYGGANIKLVKKFNPETLEDALEKLFDKYKDFKVKIPKKKITKTLPLLAVVNLYDAHLDKIPLKSTTGEYSSLKRNLDTFRWCFDEICRYLQKNEIRNVVFPIGNDLFHTNGMDNKTKKGTALEFYCSPEESYYQISDLMTECINKLYTICDEVQVIMIKGNHDADKITTLGFWLNRVFKDYKGVSVDYTRRQRKYISFGENLLGFAHGDKEKSKIAQLPLIMAQEEPKLWGNSTFRKIYCGDLHHGFEYQFLKAKEYPGTEVEFLRSVGTSDEWHHDHGYIGIHKTAYVQIFHPIDGEKTREKFPIK